MSAPATIKKESAAAGNLIKQQSAYQVDFQQQSYTIQKDTPGREGKSLLSQTEFQTQLQTENVGLRQDYMTLMSNTLSEEDYARLSKEGFPLEEMSPDETVTIVDSIKAQMALSGEEIKGYNDDLDRETLSKAVGSDTLANTLLQSFREADIPVTEENTKQILQSVEMATGLQQPTDGEYRFMVREQKEPEIGNFYLAENSVVKPTRTMGQQQMKNKSSVVDAAPAVSYYVEEAGGYLLRQGGEHSWNGMEEQIRKAVTDFGYEETDPSFSQHLEQGEWLIQQDLPLTKENLELYHRLTSVTFPITKEQATLSAAIAVGEGKAALQGNLEPQNLQPDATIYQKAVKLSKQLASRRQLEEVRLTMTAEVNVKLMKSGFAIDTAPMEDLITALKQAEQEVADSYFPQDSQSVEKYRLYADTKTEIAMLPTYPAKLAGYWDVQTSGSLQDFGQEGKIQTARYKEADQAYETLGTAPRRDLGDSVQKAFANVDSLLREMEIPLTEQNRRAARILGYNEMAFTETNLSAVKTTDALLTRVIDKLTPAAALDMIREGVNPLERSLWELDTYLTEKPQTFSEKAEDYSRFLYHLEQHKEITSGERSAYIGIYRLVHQLEKKDGAPIGAIVNMQAEPSFRNLLTALRTVGKSIDASIDSSFGARGERETKRDSNISRQIQAGFDEIMEKIAAPEDTAADPENTATVSEETEAYSSYEKQRLVLLRQAVQDFDGITLLKRGEIPINLMNLMAAKTLENAADTKWAKQLLAQDTEVDKDADTATSEDVEQLWEKIGDKEQFTEEYTDTLDKKINAAEKKALNEAKTYVDLKEMQLFHKQLQIMSGLKLREEYYLPMELGGQIAAVKVSFRQEEQDKGKIQLRLHFNPEEEDTNITGTITADRNRITGYFTANTRQAVEKLQRVADIVTNTHEQTGQTVSLQILLEETTGSRRFSQYEGNNPVKSDDLNDTALDNRQLYGIAREFLQGIKSVYQ